MLTSLFFQKKLNFGKKNGRDFENDQIIYIFSFIWTSFGKKMQKKLAKIINKFTPGTHRCASLFPKKSSKFSECYQFF